jgi:hypothetical protein
MKSSQAEASRWRIRFASLNEINWPISDPNLQMFSAKTVLRIGQIECHLIDRSEKAVIDGTFSAILEQNALSGEGSPFGLVVFPQRVF